MSISPQNLGMVSDPTSESVSNARADNYEAANRSDRKCRVLVVDNDHEAADSLAMLLSARGHDVHVTYGSEQALTLAPGLSADLILLDIGMPFLNGYEVCRRLRQQPFAEKTAIVAVTGWGDKEDLARGQKAGFDHHLVKPVSSATIQELIDNLPLRES